MIEDFAARMTIAETPAAGKVGAKTDASSVLNGTEIACAAKLKCSGNRIRKLPAE
jgi:hypothetical protein